MHHLRRLHQLPARYTLWEYHPVKKVWPTVIKAWRPLLIEFSNLTDGALNNADVFAFLIDTSADAGNVPSNLSK